MLLQQNQGGKFFIDYSPKHFQAILDFLRTSKIRKSNMEHEEELKEDFAFFRIPFPGEVVSSFQGEEPVVSLDMTNPNDSNPACFDVVKQWMPLNGLVALYKATRYERMQKEESGSKSQDI
jgi:hypothetical protein